MTAIIASATDAVITISIDQRINRFNAAAEKMFASRYLEAETLEQCGVDFVKV